MPQQNFVEHGYKSRYISTSAKGHLLNNNIKKRIKRYQVLLKLNSTWVPMTSANRPVWLYEGHIHCVCKTHNIPSAMSSHNLSVSGKWSIG